MPLSSSIKPFLSIPGPPRIPLLGNSYLYQFGSSNILKYHKFLEKLYKTYGPLVRQTLGSKTMVHVFDPDDIQMVYRNESHIPHIVPLLDSAKWYREKNNMSLGLGFINGMEWYKMRRAVRKMMLRPKEVYYYLPFIQEVAEDFVSRINEKRDPVGVLPDLSMEVAKWALESAGLICFEKRLGCMNSGKTEKESEKMINEHSKIFEITAHLKFALPFYKYISTPKWRKLIEAEDVFYGYAISFIEETISEIRASCQSLRAAEPKYNFLTYLLSREELSDEDVVIITFSMFTDGLSTTVPALLYNLYTLATNLEVQKHVHEEILSVIGNSNTITLDHINNLSLLKATVKETFRFYPIGTEISRLTEKDMILSGYEVPSGTHVDLCPMVHFLSEKYFPRANIFEPERWLRSAQKSTVHPYLLTPFGHGTRSCAGQRFAEQHLYVMLCLIIKQFHLRYLHSKPLIQKYNTLLFPDGPVRIQFTPRS